MKTVLALCLALIAVPALAADPTTARIGDVSTTFRVLGKNDRIVVDRYDDPKVQNVSCYVSRAETGGIAGSFGLATDPSRFSIACRATGHPVVQGKLPDNEVVFGTAANWAFKEIRVSRMIDRERNVLIYLVWSTQALSKGGSPYNSITAVAIDPS
ncbi:CreA family protein [Acidisphaera sp. L21]|uniref:CreA family protein n=1 Tax=Acidisphaera sp. L21 TaxID=1641851 RepID=UPI00131D6F3A|nr:CreA family protein [Acidisphaera sp. L21]